MLIFDTCAVDMWWLPRSRRLKKGSMWLRKKQKTGHNRSPVILYSDDERMWIDSSLPLAEVTKLLKPYSGDLMNAYPISNAIKSPSAFGIQLLDPVGQRVFPEHEYKIYGIPI